MLSHLNTARFRPSRFLKPGRSWLTVVLFCLFTLGLVFSRQLAAQTCNDAITASTPDSRFSINIDGSVLDKHTNLVWKRCLEGMSGKQCEQGTATEFTWQTALQHAAKQGDWRLPNIKELASIVELKCYNPAINLTVFPDTPSDSIVWSGSPVSYNANSAWVVHFGYGYDNYDHRDFNRHVRLVRERQ